jgi:hypothetical protein
VAQGGERSLRSAARKGWGACHYSQVPTTVLNDAGTVDGHALSLLPEMVARYAPTSEITPGAALVG